MAILTSDTNLQTRSMVSVIQQHTVPQTIFIHLLPGVLITVFYFLAAPALIDSGFPPVLSLYLAILLVLIPFELGFLFYQGKKLNGRYSLNGIVLFREHLPIRKIILMIIPLVVWSALVFTQLSKLDSLISQTLFAWFPAWSFPDNLFGDVSQYSKTALTITIMAGFLLNGFAGPIVEELFFRGYLLPRIPASRWWAPLINITLFSLYHFFTPWQNISRILAFLPFGYAVAWKKNVFISICAHCLMNIGGMVIAFTL